MKKPEQTINPELISYTVNGNKGVKTTVFPEPDLTKYSGPVVGTGSEAMVEDNELTPAKS